MAKWSAKTIKQGIDFAVDKLGLDFPLKSKQVEAITAFVSGQDCFVSLPTGYGKSLCFVLLPLVFDFLHGRESSLVICVSPLIALMVDQATKYSSMGLRCVYVDDIDDADVQGGVRDGRYQLMFMSPESVTRNPLWKEILTSKLYQDNLVGLIIDEAHCVKCWGDKFREDYKRLGEIRSIVPTSVKVMALTATATSTTRRDVIQRLVMIHPAIVYLPPTKRNIFYVVAAKVDLKNMLNPIIEDLLRSNVRAQKRIIYCRHLNEVADVYEEIERMLGKNLTYPPGAPTTLQKYRLVDMYTSCVEKELKFKIVPAFVNPSGTLRVVVATTDGAGL